LDKLGREFICWKRYRSTLLIRLNEWERAPRDRTVPWQLWKELMARGDADPGYLRPADWIRLAKLRKEQLIGLSDYVPDAEFIRQFQPLFLLYASMGDGDRKAVGRPEGAAWSELSQNTRNRLLALLAPGDARTCRVRVMLDGVSSPPTYGIYLGADAPVFRPREGTFQPIKKRKSFALD
jgi:hypothetical protein